MTGLAHHSMMLFTAALRIDADVRALLERRPRAGADIAEAAGCDPNLKVALVLQILRGQYHGVSADLASFAFEVRKQVLVFGGEVAPRVDQRYLLMVGERH